MAICQHQGKGCLVGVNLSAFETFACSWPGTPGEVRAMESTVHLLPAGGGRKKPGDSLGWKCRWCGCAWGQGGSWLLEVGLVGKPAWLWVSLHGHVSGNPGLRPGKESVEHSSKRNLCCRSTVASWFGFKISAFFWSEHAGSGLVSVTAANSPLIGTILQ